MQSNSEIKLNYEMVDDIPVVWCDSVRKSSKGLVIWLPGFSGTKESVIPQLQDLSKEGFVGLSFDPHQHGERKVESQSELVNRVVGNIRRYFWPILAHTSEEFLRVIDWAEENLNVLDCILAGGVSMGGDIAVAAAGVDQRIVAVSACIATPDWLRPGSHEPPGEPDRYAQYAYERRNPLTNTGCYAHCPAISFQCGKNDTQVPPDGAERFVAALEEKYPARIGSWNVVKHENTGHHFSEEMWKQAVAWFHRHS